MRATLPDAKVTGDPDQLLSHQNLDLIIVAAPNSLHFPMAETALKNGMNVVVEKPFVTDLKQGRILVDLARDSGKLLSVFHNRRWDADFLTVKRLIESGKLGDIKQFESHFDRWRPQARPERWREQALEGSGLLFDLGTHLIDQALVLFGSPDALTADIGVQKSGSLNDDFFHLILKYGPTRVIIPELVLFSGNTSVSNFWRPGKFYKIWSRSSRRADETRISCFEFFLWV